MVGLSANPYRPSHFVAIYMKAAGYEIPVNPREKKSWAAPATRRCPSYRSRWRSWIYSRDVGRAGHCGRGDSSRREGGLDAMGAIHEAAAIARATGLEVVMDRSSRSSTPASAVG
jgi:hypothetical protein